MRKIIMIMAVLTLLTMTAFAGCDNKAKEAPAEAPAANATQGS